MEEKRMICKIFIYIKKGAETEFRNKNVDDFIV
jgi:hypothetical protein